MNLPSNCHCTADILFKLPALDQFLCADEKHERAVGRSQHTVDLVDADVAVFCRLLGGQCHFQMDRNGADAILHVKAPFLGLSAEQTSRRFQIVGSGAFAEAVPVEADGNANFQNAVVDPALIQTGSLLHRDDWDIRGDDHRLASQPPAIDDIKNALFAEACISFRAQIVQYEKVGTHKRFRVMVAVRAEIALHTVDYIRHSHKEDRLQTVNQGVGNAASRIGFAGADIPKQEKPDFIAFEAVPVLNILFRLTFQFTKSWD